MTRTEFKEIGLEVFSEVLPKVKRGDAHEMLDCFLAELLERDVHIEDDEVETENEEDSLSF